MVQKRIPHEELFNENAGVIDRWLVTLKGHFQEDFSVFFRVTCKLLKYLTKYLFTNQSNIKSLLEHRGENITVPDFSREEQTLAQNTQRQLVNDAHNFFKVAIHFYPDQPQPKITS